MERVKNDRARVRDINERVVEEREREERVYIYYLRAGKARDLYFRSFLSRHERH